MRIDPNGRAQQAQDAGEANSPSARPTAATPSQSASLTDTAQLSADQVRVQALSAQVNALPEIRQEKVAALGRAIRDGTYQVSPEQTAEAMLAEFSPQSLAA